MKKDYYKEYYQKNKEKIKAHVSTYKEANRKQVLSAKRAYYYAHKDEINRKRREEMTPEQREENRIKCQKWREANLGAEKERHRQYYLEHKEHCLEKNKEWREENRAKTHAQIRLWRLKNPGKVKDQRRRDFQRTGGASFKVAYAIKTGEIVPRSCEVCGATKAQAHHDDYNKPLEVRWLCREHHEEWHKHNKPIYLTEKV